MAGARVAGRAVAGALVGLLLAGAAARGELIHRYSFDGDAGAKDAAAAGGGGESAGATGAGAAAGETGAATTQSAAVKDSVGKAHGALKGAAKLADGKLVLDNKDKMSNDPALSYVEFGGPILPKAGSVTVVAWVTIPQNPPFARVVDVGDVEAGEGRAFLYLMTRHEEDDQSRAAITASDVAERTFANGAALDDGKPHMAAVVVDGAAKKLRYFVDGKASSAAEDLVDNTLDKVRQAHAWIGRSPFDTDPGLSGSIDELRVYDHAMSEQELKALSEAGPDKAPAAAGPTTAPAAAAK